MKFVAAFLLANLGGKLSPTRDDVRGILDSVGAEVEEHRLEMFFREVDGKDATELITAGRERLAYLPCGGGAAAVDAGPATVTATTEEKEKAEEKVEDEEEDDLNMLSLFD